MNFKKLVQENLKLDSSKIIFDESMSNHTSFKIGGLAECLIKVETIEEMQKICKFAKTNNIQLTIIGNGSNLLVLDKGIKGIVVKINIKKFDLICNEEEVKLTVGAGNKLGEVAQKLLRQEVTGFEFAAGIPGSIGGAIRMNAGAYGGEMKDIVETVKYMDYDGKIYEKKNEDLAFEYRKSMFSNNKYIILEATFKLKKGNKEEIKNKMEEYEKSRKEKQPLEYPNAGSTFKRGSDFVTAKLIDEAGLKGYKVGGAMVSTKHAGFVINTGDATAKDVLELTNYIKKTVYEKFKKNIELEIEIIGKEL